MNKIDQILLVDDHHPTNVIHKINIEAGKCAKTVKVFTDPVSALKYLEPLAKKSYTGSTLVVVDINMPRINGWVFANKLAAMLTNSRFGPKIILTSNTRPSDLQAKMRSEPLIYDYMEKNITTAQFVQLANLF